MKIFLSLVVLLFSANVALGCSYIAYPEPAVEFIAANTGKIYLGRVISKTSSVQIEDGDKYRVYTVKLRVERSLKGVTDGEIQYLRVTESITNRTSCSRNAPNFKKGEQWIILGDFNETSNISNFSGSFPEFGFYDSKYNQDYFEALDRALKNPVTAIYGQIHGFKSYARLRNAEIRLEGGGLRLKTTTDTNGDYSFKNLPPGKYKVKIPLPKKTKDYFANIETIFAPGTQTHNLEYDFSVVSGDAFFQFTVLGDSLV